MNLILINLFLLFLIIAFTIYAFITKKSLNYKLVGLLLISYYIDKDVKLIAPTYIYDSLKPFLYFLEAILLIILLIRFFINFFKSIKKSKNTNSIK